MNITTITCGNVKLHHRITVCCNWLPTGTRPQTWTSTVQLCRRASSSGLRTWPTTSTSTATSWWRRSDRNCWRCRTTSARDRWGKWKHNLLLAGLRHYFLIKRKITFQICCIIKLMEINWYVNNIWCFKYFLISAFRKNPFSIKEDGGHRTFRKFMINILQLPTYLPTGFFIKNVNFKIVMKFLFAHFFLFHAVICNQA